MRLADETFRVDLINVLRCSDGRAATHPVRVDSLIFQQGVIARRIHDFMDDGIPCHSVEALTPETVTFARRARKPASAGRSMRGCIISPAQPLRQFGKQNVRRLKPVLAEISGREQSRNEAVFVCGPNASVFSKKRRAGAFLAGKIEAAISQPVHEPLESHRHLKHRPAQGAGHPVYDGTADHCLADITARKGAAFTAEIMGAGCQIIVRRASAHCGSRSHGGRHPYRSRSKRRTPPCGRAAATWESARNNPCGSCHPSHGGIIRNVGSTVGSVTVRAIPYLAAIAAQ